MDVGGATLQIEQNAFSFSGIRTDTLHIEDERFKPGDYLKKGEEAQFQHISETSNLVKIVDADLELRHAYITQTDDASGSIKFSTDIAVPDLLLDGHSLASHVNLSNTAHTTFLKDVKL